jgi:D-3-phosphoglycerate dehydrogenase
VPSNIHDSAGGQRGDSMNSTISRGTLTSQPLRVVVTVDPFGEPARKALQALGGHVTYNAAGRKLTREEVTNLLVINQPNVIIAGTEKYDEELLARLPHLELIARVGVGYDGVDLAACRHMRNVHVSYGPTTCTNAVAELTIMSMVANLRHVRDVSIAADGFKWNRFIGRELRDCEVGIIGVGRIGSAVIEKLQSLKPRRIFINDLLPERMEDKTRCEPASKGHIFSSCDIITLHVPGSPSNIDLVSWSELAQMKKDAVLFNFSRGGIINETALYEHCRDNRSFRAAVDTFVEEPYKGPLSMLTNVTCTPHLGSCTTTARLAMEGQAVEDVANFLHGKPIAHLLV